ncbi:conserved hypothetical protein [Vibrio nigripulchritudo SFn27]|uniref:Uncharacterized protein n=1 Tax=Vibrio nigripulchritudo TaxID=28173 RepID=U4KHW2_9VIBR|nr:hypothetical protein [Vibrio nigripulchritudo]CCN82912.1 conserved hypothetical protein [Vibrio nigripulchritudo BLFn1]CCN89615.1 conserved hypothetical protein [Vibrio nigripulchritudo SFn27]CCN94426.1 conserved hypothetical protein [Vibrio nigripulchritudo ENn2]CCO39808.1 conserved hypothetical protein [Vibrio nigripulchritudo SFn135]CCO52279.1 conserved hypothetical protein [Vibrio nigripulchritudo Wn13]
MSTKISNITVLSAAISVVFLASSSATFAHTAHTGGMQAEKSNATVSAFDIVHTKATTQGNTATFHIAVSGQAGTVKPTPTGKLAGSDVFSYVWPTTLNSAEVGFEKDAGILAFAVTSHPDFDDTPLYDENGDGDKTNDGDVWHSHWVVLHPNEQCGPGALGVVDIPEGAKPKLPATWPELPLLIDSPDYTPNFDGESLNVEVKFEDIDALKLANFDGVTAGLRVNASAHSPLLCVKDVFDVASGNLSLPGVVNQ